MASRMPSSNAVSQAEVEKSASLSASLLTESYFPRLPNSSQKLKLLSRETHIIPQRACRLAMWKSCDLLAWCQDVQAVQSCCTTADRLANMFPGTRVSDRKLSFPRVLWESALQQCSIKASNINPYKAPEHSLRADKPWLPLQPQQWSVSDNAWSLLRNGGVRELKRENLIGITSPSSSDVHCYEANLWRQAFCLTGVFIEHILTHNQSDKQLTLT